MCYDRRRSRGLIRKHRFQRRDALAETRPRGRCGWRLRRNARLTLVHPSPWIDELVGVERGLTFIGLGLLLAYLIERSEAQNFVLDQVVDERALRLQLRLLALGQDFGNELFNVAARDLHAARKQVVRNRFEQLFHALIALVAVASKSLADDRL